MVLGPHADADAAVNPACRRWELLGQYALSDSVIHTVDGINPALPIIRNVT